MGIVSALCWGALRGILAASASLPWWSFPDRKKDKWRALPKNHWQAAKLWESSANGLTRAHPNRLPCSYSRM